MSPPSSANGADDGTLNVHDLGDPFVLGQIETYAATIGEQSYINPYYPVERLRQKLASIGLTFDRLPPINEEGDLVELQLSHFGGRFGRLNDESLEVGFDDGITPKLGYGLALRLEFNKNDLKRWDINASIVKTGLEGEGIGVDDMDGMESKRVQEGVDDKIERTKQELKKGLQQWVADWKNAAGSEKARLKSAIDNKIQMLGLDSKTVYSESVKGIDLSEAVDDYIGPDSIEDIAIDVVSRIQNHGGHRSTSNPSFRAFDQRVVMIGIFKSLGHPELSILRATDFPTDWDTKPRDEQQKIWIKVLSTRKNALIQKRKELGLTESVKGGPSRD